MLSKAKNSLLTFALVYWQRRLELLMILLLKVGLLYFARVIYDLIDRNYHIGLDKYINSFSLTLTYSS